MITDQLLEVLATEPGRLRALVDGGNVEVAPQVLRDAAQLAELALEIQLHRENAKHHGCPAHGGSVHGGEAEELRDGLAKILEAQGLTVDDLRYLLQLLLDNVDARDSLAWLEAQDMAAAQTAATPVLVVETDRGDAVAIPAIPAIADVAAEIQGHRANTKIGGGSVHGGSPSAATSPAVVLETKIPHLTFSGPGIYDLSTTERRAAAAEHALRCLEAAGEHNSHDLGAVIMGARAGRMADQLKLARASAPPTDAQPTDPVPDFGAVIERARQLQVQGNRRDLCPEVIAALVLADDLGQHIAVAVHNLTQGLRP